MKYSPEVRKRRKAYTDDWKKRNADKDHAHDVKYREEHREEIRIRDKVYYYKYKNRRTAISTKYAKIRIGKLKAWWIEYRKSLKCEHCGETRWMCLDFHHRDPKCKDRDLSALVCRGSSRNRILLEVDKCFVLCSNCHRELHYKIRAGVLDARC